MTPAGLMASVTPTRIPEVADARRMQQDRLTRIRGLMRAQGVDALVLLGNTNVVYATGAIWPLADSGRANFEQPVAVVHVHEVDDALVQPGLARGHDPLGDVREDRVARRIGR